MEDQLKNVKMHPDIRLAYYLALASSQVRRKKALKRLKERWRKKAQQQDKGEDPRGERRPRRQTICFK